MKTSKIGNIQIGKRLTTLGLAVLITTLLTACNCEKDEKTENCMDSVTEGKYCDSNNIYYCITRNNNTTTIYLSLIHI